MAVCSNAWIWPGWRTVRWRVSRWGLAIVTVGVLAAVALSLLTAGLEFVWPQPMVASNNKEPDAQAHRRPSVGFQSVNCQTARWISDMDHLELSRYRLSGSSGSKETEAMLALACTIANTEGSTKSVAT